MLLCKGVDASVSCVPELVDDCVGLRSRRCVEDDNASFERAGLDGSCEDSWRGVRDENIVRGGWLAVGRASEPELTPALAPFGGSATDTVIHQLVLKDALSLPLAS